jgi:hypothetical protein
MWSKLGVHVHYKWSVSLFTTHRMKQIQLIYISTHYVEVVFEVLTVVQPVPDLHKFSLEQFLK